jgi:hypothetical protein
MTTPSSPAPDDATGVRFITLGDGMQVRLRVPIMLDAGDTCPDNGSVRLPKGVRIMTMLVALSASACGGSGAKSLTPAQRDLNRVQAMQLRLTDFKPGWVQVAPNAGSRACEPDLSGFPPTAGTWGDPGVEFKRGSGVTVQSGAITLRSPEDADLAFLKLTSSMYTDCVVRELQSSRLKGVRFLKVQARPLQPQPLADDVDGFRVVISARAKSRKYKIYIDSLVYRQDRALARFRFVSLVRPGDEDSEWRLARVSSRRGLDARA